ncbi:MAG: hypothetical protein LBG91_05765 [Treponema sp.]|jgi:hypothetical protein|nr:hypothetical protein [Treponema sp.]
MSVVAWHPGWRKIFRLLLCLTIFILTLDSCIGVSADIQMRGDGSGKIVLEYRFSRMAEALGRLDGNERWQIIPAGRADLERTLARIPDMKLASFSTGEEAAPVGNDKDIVNKATLEFKNTEALLKFLDPAGRRAVLSRSNGSNSLSVIITEPATSPESPEMDADLLELMRKVSAGYRFRLSFSAEGNSVLALTGAAGETIATPPDAKIISSGKKVSFETGTGELLGSKQGLGLRFTW